MSNVSPYAVFFLAISMVIPVLAILVSLIVWKFAPQFKKALIPLGAGLMGYGTYLIADTGPTFVLAVNWLSAIIVLGTFVAGAIITVLGTKYSPI